MATLVQILGLALEFHVVPCIYYKHLYEAMAWCAVCLQGLFQQLEVILYTYCTSSRHQAILFYYFSRWYAAVVPAVYQIWAI